MKLELIKEEKIGERPWYMLFVDEKYITGNYNLENVTDLYRQVINTNGECLKPKREVLASEIIDVSL